MTPQEKVIELVREMGMSDTELSRRVKENRAWARRRIKEGTPIAIDELPKFAIALGKPCSWFFEGTDCAGVVEKRGARVEEVPSGNRPDLMVVRRTAEGEDLALYIEVKRVIEEVSKEAATEAIKRYMDLEREATAAREGILGLQATKDLLEAYKKLPPDQQRQFEEAARELRRLRGSTGD